MKVFLIRHGHTDGLIAGIIQPPDMPLNQLGRQQAERLAERLRAEHFDAIYSSDMQRAVETANAIARFHPKLPVQFTPELREQAVGSMAGQHHDVYVQAREAAGLPFQEFLPPEGETIIQVKRRVENFYRELCRRHPDETVALVTHGGVIGALLLHVHDQTFDNWGDYRFHNTSVSVLETDSNGKHTIHFLNNVDHLDKELLPDMHRSIHGQKSI